MSKTNKLNLRGVAFNRHDNGIPREIWITEGPDFLSLNQEKNRTPYDTELYAAIQDAIDRGVINTTNTLTLSSGTEISITGAGTQEDPYVINFIGTLGEENVNADWNATEGDAEILNKPTIPTLTSELTNDSGFITEDNQDASEVDFTPTGNTTSTNVQAAIEEIQTELDLTITNQHSPVTAADISIEVTDQAIKVNLSEDADNQAELRVDGIYVPATVPGTGEDNVNADWDATSGDAEILNKPIIPTLTSELTNDSGFLTSYSQDASQTPNIPVGNLTSTNVQDALEELQSDIDSINSANHLPASSGSPNIEVDAAQRISAVVSPDAGNALETRTNGLYATNSGSGSSSYIKTKEDKAQYFAKSSSTVYTLSNGVALFAIDNFGDMSSATLLVDRAEDSLNDNFTVIIKHLDNSVNTWVPDNDGSIDHDLYVPQFHIYNALTTRTPLFNQSLSDRSSDLTNGIVPEIEFGNGEVRLLFKDSHANWTSTQRILIQLNLNY